MSMPSTGPVGVASSSNDLGPIDHPLPPMVTYRHGWLWVAILLTAVKIWLTSGQTLFAIGPAVHDDRLFAELAEQLIKGNWLGSYNQFTLAKGPLYPIFIALVFWIGAPLLLAQQILYAAACATFTLTLGPWIRSAWSRCGIYLLLLWNPISFDAGNLSRLMRQNLYTPLALFAIAGLILFHTRRRQSAGRLVLPAILAGFSLGGFWLTREESIWLLPTIGLLCLGIILSLRHDLKKHWRTLTIGFGIFAFATALPSLTISTLNWKHYGWFGTVEFRASEFKDAYGALTRPLVGPTLKQVPVTRAMREAIYEVSPAFSKLRPFLEGSVGDHWADTIRFPAEDRQMRGGWFVWALRDAVAEAGLANDARTAMQFYQQIADEVNTACSDGRLSARGPRSGFIPELSTDLWRPLYNTTIEYTTYFGYFRGFTAYSPDSRGDYAELKVFRDLVGTRLSNAPRSPMPLAHEVKAVQDRKLGILQSFGLTFASLLSWIGPILLLVGAVRVIESIIDQRISYPLGLAGALISGCAAYLVINVLVHVTSFHNQSTAALAAAYPLYLAALALIAVDAWRSWRSARDVRSPQTQNSLPVSKLLWLTPLGISLIILAAQLCEIHLFGSDIPRHEQWVVEAQQIILPWLNGSLGLAGLFQSNLEHVPVWTRLLTWGEITFTGRWDPLFQMTVNAVFFACFAGLITRWSLRTFHPASAAVLTAFLLLCGALPYNWENVTWGYQSSYPLALLFLFLHAHGSCLNEPWTRRWWWAQGAAFAGLFTLSSMWLSPVVVIISSLWTKPRHFRDYTVPLGIGIVGAVIFLSNYLQLPHNGLAQHMSGSAITFWHSCLLLLGWPSPVPGALAIIQLPWLIHALRLRNSREASGSDHLIFALGLWNFLHVLLLAATKSGATGDLGSRYEYLLMVGLLAGAAATLRMIPQAPRIRTLYLTLGVFWGTLVVGGLVQRSVEGQARNFHRTAVQNAEARRSVVQHYLDHQNGPLLEDSSSRWLIYQDLETVARLLDDPSFQALLPASVNPRNAPDLFGRIARGLQSHWLGILGIGSLLTLVGFALLRHNATRHPRLPQIEGNNPWPWRISAGSAALSALLLFGWDSPFTLNPEKRWQRTLGADLALQNVSYYFVGTSPYKPERLHGAAPITPEILRNQFRGTAPDGPGYTGTVVSSIFQITQPWLIIPYAGYPIGHGNGLRLRIIDETGKEPVDEIGCPGPNSETIAYWTVDLRALQGRRAQIVLYDGRTDTEAWVAVAAPIPTAIPKLGGRLTKRLHRENFNAVHSGLFAILLISLSCATISRFTYRKS